MCVCICHAWEEGRVISSGVHATTCLMNGNNVPFNRSVLSSKYLSFGGDGYLIRASEASPGDSLLSPGSDAFRFWQMFPCHCGYQSLDMTAFLEHHLDMGHQVPSPSTSFKVFLKHFIYVLFLFLKCISVEIILNIHLKHYILLLPVHLRNFKQLIHPNHLASSVLSTVSLTWNVHL